MIKVDIWIDSAKSSIRLELPEGSTLRDAVELLARKHQGKAKPNAIIFVGKKDTGQNLDKVLSNDDSIHVQNPT